MQQIADWLEKLGMSEYAQRFAENAIDFSVLSDLTDQDLEKLGVLLGHRRKLLRAIANLEGIEKGAPAVPVAPAPSATQRAAETAERRQVTVMFTRAFLIGVAGTPVAWSTSFFLQRPRPRSRHLLSNTAADAFGGQPGARRSHKSPKSRGAFAHPLVASTSPGEWSRAVRGSWCVCGKRIPAPRRERIAFNVAHIAPLV